MPPLVANLNEPPLPIALSWPLGMSAANLLKVDIFSCSATRSRVAGTWIELDQGF